MGAYINFRNVLKVEQDEREYKDSKTAKNGVVATLEITTTNGTTTINIFKEVEE